MRIFSFSNYSAIGIIFTFVMLTFLPVSGQYLKTSGTKIVDPNGDEVIWRGIGLGGWMLQEGYMLRTSGPQHQLEARIETLVGAAKKQEFYDAWLANHTRKIDIDSMASWGYNSVRLAMHYKLFTPPIEEEPVAGQITWIDKGFEMTDQLLEWCKANNMYLILDLHAAPGGQGKNADISDYDPTKPSLWESAANRAKTIALWQKLAERYANEPMIGGYDLINEPNWGFQNINNDPNGCAESQNTILWQLQRDITNAIREVDKNHIIIIEGNCWGNNYAGLPTLWDNNMVISYHKYWNGNDQGSIQGMINMRNQRNVPIWLGETGENSNSWYTDCISLLESNGIGWAWWPLKKLGINNPLHVVAPASYQQILNFWNGSGAKPSEANAYGALMQLAENLKLENNNFKKDVVDAKIRQPHTNETLPFKNHLILSDALSIVHATDYDLGKVGYAYFDTDYTNTTGNAGGAAWNLGYTYRNDGVDIEVTSDLHQNSNGYNVGWTNDGEWLQYTVNIDSSAAYNITVRYAGTSTGRIKICVDGVDATGTVSLPSTGGWQVWRDLTIENVPILSGERRIRFYIEKAGFNFGYISFFLNNAISEIPFKAISAATNLSGDSVFLVLNKSANPATLNTTGFSLKVGGQSFSASEVIADNNLQNVISFVFATEILDDQSLSLNYGGEEVQAGDGSVLEKFSSLVVTNNIPFHFKIPTTIQAEDFYVNVGLELENTQDVGGGQNLGFTSTGDYLLYNISVKDSGLYSLEVRIACLNNAGKLSFEQLDNNGQILNKSEINVPVTGGWQTWRTIETTIKLNAGRGVLKVTILDPEFNINWYRLNKLVILSTETSDDINAIRLFPNPTSSKFSLELPVEMINENGYLVIRDLTGKIVFKKDESSMKGILTIDAGKLPEGVYILELSSSGKKFQQKLIIN